MIGQSSLQQPEKKTDQLVQETAITRVAGCSCFGQENERFGILQTLNQVYAELQERRQVSGLVY